MARVAAVIAATAVVATASVTTPALAAPEDPVAITITAADVLAAAENVNGLTFKGFGVLSANSTSSLLMDYKAQQPEKYWELIETLFGGDNPIFNTVKIEMGNDRNTSTGPNASTMRTRDEYPNVQREPGFQLAADAKKVAHGDVHVSLLRWNRPAWVTSDADQYIWFKNTILAVYREYGYMVDSVNPDSNETSSPNTELYKTFSGWLRGDESGYVGATTDDPNNGYVSQEEKDLYLSIETIAADTVGTPPVSFGNAMTSSTDSSLRDAVDIVGFHYSNADDSAGNMKKIAEELDKEVWNSEGQATFSNSADRPNNTNSDEQGGTGTQFGGTNSALEMVNWVTTGFSMSRRTLNIFQPAIGSFYDGFQYSSKELVSARDPWSGWIYYDGALAVTQQFTQFAKLGWENEDNTAGIWRGIPQASYSALGGGNPPSGARAGNASYTTLAAPDASDFSTIIVNDSKFTKTYTITAADLNLGEDATMEVWETRAADDGEAYDANYVKPIAELSPDANGTYTVTVQPWSTVTATTLDHATANGDGTFTANEGYGNQIPTSDEYTAEDGGRDVLDTDATGKTNGVTDDTILYADDFEYDTTATISTYDPTTGALVDSGESFLESRGSKDKPAGTPNVQAEDNGATPLYTNDTNGAFESVATTDSEHGRVLRQQIGVGMNGGAWNGGDPKTTIGDFRWANYKVSVDVRFEAGSGQYATLGAREQGGTSNGQNVSAAELKITQDGAWTLMRFGSTVASGSVAGNAAVGFKSGTDVWNTLSVQVAGDVYTAYVNGVQIASYQDASPQATGRIQLGTGFTFVQFDNLVVETVPGYTPYYTDQIDGMHQTSWEDTSVPVLEFNSLWSHVNGQGMYEWQRTASNSTGKGASLTYTFTGTGLDIIGTNTGAATLDVTVDGVTIATNQATYAAGSERTAFTLRGLPNGEHTVTLTTANAGVINVDAVGVIKANADSAAVDTTALAAATAAVADLDEAEYQADGWAVFSSLLGDAEAATADPVTYGLDAEGAAAIVKRLNTAAASLIPTDVSEDSVSLGLIAVVAADGLPTSLSLGGDPVAVVWDGDAATQFAAASSLGTVALTGRSSAKLAETGLYQRFSATVLVVPDDLVYFIDSGSSNSAAGSVFAAVSAAFPGLANNAADQKWDGTTAGSTWGYATTATAITAGTAADWASSFLGADYSKPITYSLTLPAGSYDIVTIQPARSGATTNIYSTVTAGSYTNRITAVSSGAATPITQRVTVSQETVVKVEYGTNGTSGYNARLALVYVQAVPRDLGVQAALTVGSPLPGTVTIDGVETAVTWDEASLAKTLSAYQLVSVAGTVSVAGVEQQITAKYEIIPDGLVYYVDSGTNGVDSPQYLAVKAAVPGLLNQTADQASTSADQWGYVATTLKLKGSTDINDKYSTGWYEDSTNLVYRLSLEPGTYTLTGGFTEWWNITRTMNHSVSANGVELAKGNIALSGSNTPLAEQLTFTLTEAATVQYLVTNEGAGGEKPVISWLAVAQEEEPEPEFVLPAKIVAKLATGVTYQVGDSFALGADALTVTGTDAAGAAVEIDQAGLSSNAPATFTKAGNYVVKVTYTVEGQSVSTSIVVRVVAKTLTLN